MLPLNRPQIESALTLPQPITHWRTLIYERTKLVAALPC